MSGMQWHVHKGKGGPILVQYSLSNHQQLEFWVDPPSIAEGGFIVNEVFNEQEYLKHGVTLRPGDTVVDVGANIGVFGARVLSLVPGGDVNYIGVEPCPQTYQLLQQNLLGADGQGQQNSVFHINEALSAPVQQAAAPLQQAATPLQQAAAPLQQAAGGRSCPGYPGNVRLVQTALSSCEGSCTITYYPHMPGNSTMRPAEKQQLQHSITPPKFLEGAETLEVPKTTLSQLLTTLNVTGPIRLLKIDVEGEELEVLRGLDEVCWGRVQQIALEVHDVIDGQVPSSCANTTSANGAAAAAAAVTPLQAAAAPAADIVVRQDQPGTHHVQQQQQQQQQQQHPAEGQGNTGETSSTAAAAAAAAALGRFPRLQALMATLPGPRTCRDIDGVHIRYHPLPVRIPGQQPPDMDPAKAAALADITLPPPRDEGRVMVVAKLLRDKGFRVVIECSLGLPMNYTVYGVRHSAC